MNPQDSFQPQPQPQPQPQIIVEPQLQQTKGTDIFSKIEKKRKFKKILKVISVIVVIFILFIILLSFIVEEENTLIGATYIDDDGISYQLDFYPESYNGSRFNLGMSKINESGEDSEATLNSIIAKIPSKNSVLLTLSIEKSDNNEYTELSSCEDIISKATNNVGQLCDVIVGVDNNTNLFVYQFEEKNIFYTAVISGDIDNSTVEKITENADEARKVASELGLNDIRDDIRTIASSIDVVNNN